MSQNRKTVEPGAWYDQAEEAMWRAASESDSAFDGAFVYGVRTTGIFCRPSCASRVPNLENVLFFKSADEARAAGFRPCKRCRPDLTAYQPMRDTAAAAKAAIDAGEDVKALGVSPRRLSTIFREAYGITISGYVSRLRLAKAKRLLVETNRKIVEIAGDVGFDSLSAFYRFFRSGAGTTPATYRRENRIK